jgi:SAM-dependent methyltransferase
MDIKQVVREKYGQAALKVMSAEKPSCCGSEAPVTLQVSREANCCGSKKAVPLGGADPISANLYSTTETSVLPEAAVLASLGCGNPTALAELKAGEVVLDLGSGGGIDVLLSARRVGPTGKAYGLDMTEEMLALARENQAKAGVANVEFLKGDIESMPLPDATVDVIISNCVINLAADKDKVLREAYRVLKPGGRFAVSDIATRGDIPADIRANVSAWIGCLAGALDEQDYIDKLKAAGFEEVSIEPTRVYRAEDAREFLTGRGLDVDAIAPLVDERFISGFIRARKPLAQ